MKKTKICKLLDIEYPIIQGGMVWASGANLAAAASNAGCLGVIGAGSMNLELLESQITKALSLTDKPIAVNFPIMYEKSQQQIDLALKLGIKIFINSAGSPKKYTQYLKDKGCIVMHVTSNLELAKKCENAGVDAVIIEGVEAGGHNGRDELTSLVLTPQVSKALKVPVIAAGGFGCGRSIVAALALGASGVQMGTRFLLTKESSAHQYFKNLLINSPNIGTKLMLKKQVPVRMFKNKFYDQIQLLEDTDLDIKKQIDILGKGRAKSGILEGNLDEGELEIGQIYCTMNNIPSVTELVESLNLEYQKAVNEFI
jgi:enoyl-[acyl-carrier protein] reductase II